MTDNVPKGTDAARYLERKYQQQDPWSFSTNVYELIRHRVMVEFTLFNNPQKILDLGCGEGHFLQMLLSTNPALKAVGVEFIETAANRARERLVKHPVNIVNQDISDFLTSHTLGKEIYDVVILGEVLYFVEKEKIDFIIESVQKILSPKGTVLLSHYNPDIPEFTEWILKKFENQRFVRDKQIALDPFDFGKWVVTLERIKNS